MADTAEPGIKKSRSACITLLYARQAEGHLECSEKCILIPLFWQAGQYLLLYVHRVFLFKLGDPSVFQESLVIVDHKPPGILIVAGRPLVIYIQDISKTDRIITLIGE